MITKSDHGILKLSEMSAGQTGIIDELSMHIFTNRMLAMGIVPGKRLTLIRKQPWNGSYYIDVNGHFIGVRMQEAELIQIKVEF